MFWFFLTAFSIHFCPQDIRKNYNFSDTRTLTCYVLTLEKWQSLEDWACIQVFVSLLWISDWLACCIIGKGLINENFLNKLAVWRLLHPVTESTTLFRFFQSLIPAIDWAFSWLTIAKSSLVVSDILHITGSPTNI